MTLDDALWWHMFCTQWRWIALEAEFQRNVPIEIIYASWKRSPIDETRNRL